ncbi:MAG TPA: oligogalacturonate lyase [Verrucomicrobiae bacterium]|jgi:oligogalacturonide lyase
MNPTESPVQCLRLLRTVLFISGQCLLALRLCAEPPEQWLEPATGHRVLRLSREPGSTSLYFHQNAYTPEGDKLLISTPSGLSTVNLTNYAIDLVVPRGAYGGGGSSGVEVGRKSRHVYYSARGTTGTVIRATHLDTKVTRDVVRLPFNAAFSGVNADETLVVGTINQPVRGGGSRAEAASRAAPGTGRSMKFYSADLRTGAVTFFNPSTNWLNHAQCSPTDPAMMLYCHEGLWHELHRVWTLRIGTDTPRLMHRRTMPYEIAGHEFFSHDGQWVWYDLQTPRSTEFWLAGVQLVTGDRIRYSLQRGEWSVHYNVSPDGKLFAGDGGGPNSVANKTPLPENKRLNPPANGQWIYLFRPAADYETRTINGEPVKIGRFIAEKLVDLSKHDYSLEPNVTFTPDGKWLVFRSNLRAARHVYAVEVVRTKQ